MNNLLKVSKYIALMKNRFYEELNDCRMDFYDRLSKILKPEIVIDLDTIAFALSFVDFTDKKAEKIIINFLKDDNQIILDKKLKLDNRFKRVDFSGEFVFDDGVTELLLHLKRKGFENKEICQIRMDESFEDFLSESNKKDDENDEDDYDDDEDEYYEEEDYDEEDDYDDDDYYTNEEDEDDYDDDEDDKEEDDEIFFGIGKEEKEEEVEEEKIEFFEVAKKLHKNLPKIIIGQDMAIEKIVDSFKNTLDFTPDRPMMTYVFLGAPGTGKTFLAKSLEKFLDGYKLKVFDMSQYVRHDSALTLRGTDHRFSGSAPGELTSFVLHNPKAIIVFDEFEKAHNDVQNELLTIFEGAYMVDKCGWYKDDDGNFIPITDEVKMKLKGVENMIIMRE